MDEPRAWEAILHADVHRALVEATADTRRLDDDMRSKHGGVVAQALFCPYYHLRVVQLGK